MMHKVSLDSALSSPVALVHWFLHRNRRVLSHVHAPDLAGRVHSAVEKTAGLIGGALEKGGRIFVLSGDATWSARPTSPLGRARTSGVDRRVVLITPPRGSDEDRGRRAFRRLAPKPWDLVIFLDASPNTDFSVGVLKEANMWHCEPIVIARKAVSRILRLLSDIIVPVRALDIHAGAAADAIEKGATTTIVRFASPAGRKHRATGSLNEP